MVIYNNGEKFTHLGQHSLFLTTGLKRRLEMVLDLVELKDKTILDLGCGKGVFLKEFIKYTKPENVFGTEYDEKLFRSKKVEETQTTFQELDIDNYGYFLNNSKFFSETKIPFENIKNCPGEKLDFEDDKFDIVFMNEVLEHVQNDEKVIKEIYRVLKPGGIWINFTPNRLWPFEQHGISLGNKYIWGNIPLVPYLPKRLYKKLCPDVTSYTKKELLGKIMENGKWKVIKFTQIYPGFSELKRKFGKIGGFVQSIMFKVEKSKLKTFGISHFSIIKK